MTYSLMYQSGGTLAPDSQLYIPRKADTELLTLCQSGSFAYILAPRQLGKSSLMLRTAAQLVSEGYRVAKLDLTRLGTQVSAEGWYYGLIYELRKQLELDFKLREWWQEHADLGLTQRLTLFFEEVVLVKTPAPVVIFIDEIDTTLSLTFTDDFFAAVRALYVARASHPALKRLTFVLIGVATPGDLIRDPRRTPFNIGRRVEMTDFTFDEALPLASGLGLAPGAAEEVLKWILAWTGGHPYLTQRLCQVVAEENAVEPVAWTEARLAAVVSTTFFGEASEEDNNLQFVRDMLTKRAPDLSEVLKTYQKVWRARPPVNDEEQSLIKAHLKLAGIVRREFGTLKVRNLIYRTVFDEKWLTEHLPVNWAGRVRRVLGLLVAASILALLMGALALYALVQQNTASVRAKEAEMARQSAEVRRLDAESQRRTSQLQTLAFRIQTLNDPELKMLLATEASEQIRREGLVDPGGQIERLLRQAVQEYTPSRVLRGHSGTVFSAAFSPNTSRIVTAGQDGTVRLWDSATANLLLTLRGHSGQVYGAAFSPDGSVVASAGLDNSLRIWDARSGQQTALVNFCDCTMLFPGFSPDSKLLKVLAGNHVLLLNPVTGAVVGDLAGHRNGVETAIFSSDGRIIASADGVSRVRLWSAETFGLLKILDEVPDGVTALAFSPDSQKLVVATETGQINLFEVQSGVKIATLGGTGRSVTVVSFSPNGRYFASADGSMVRIWDGASGRELFNLTGYTGSVTDLLFSPDSTRLFTAGKDGVIRAWNSLNGQLDGLLYGHNGAIGGAPEHLGMSFSPDGKWLVTAGQDGTARIWDWQEASRPWLQELKGQGREMFSATFSSNGRYALTTGYGDKARLWDVTSGREAANLKPIAANNAVFSPDEAFLVTFGGDGRAIAWESASGWNTGKIIDYRRPQEVQNYPELVGGAYSSDGKLIAIADKKGTVSIWEMPGGRLVTEVSGFPAWGWGGQVFSPDGNFLVVPDANGAAVVWNTRTGEKNLTLGGHSLLVTGAVFSPNGNFIATSSQDGTARLWDAKTGRMLNILGGHSGAVNSINFSPDNRLVITSGADGITRIWDTASAHELTVLKGRGESVNSATFSPDGKTIVTVTSGNTAYIFSCKVCGTFDETLAQAKALAPRSLTPDERQQFGLH